MDLLDLKVNIFTIVSLVTVSQNSVLSTLAMNRLGNQLEKSKSQPGFSKINKEIIRVKNNPKIKHKIILIQKYTCH